MQPAQDAKSTHFHRARWHDLHAPETVVVHGGNVDRPNGAASSDQAPQHFLPANAVEIVNRRAFLLGGLRNGDYRDVLVRGFNVAFAAPIPIDVVTWI